MEELRLWFKLRSGQIEWETLIQAHQSLAMEMASIGNGLVLPGGPINDPPAGKMIGKWSNSEHPNVEYFRILEGQRISALWPTKYW